MLLLLGLIKQNGNAYQIKIPNPFNMHTLNDFFPSGIKGGYRYYDMMATTSYKGQCKFNGYEAGGNKVVLNILAIPTRISHQKTQVQL